MFRRWRERRERERVQANCPHEYSIVAEYRVSNWTGWDFDRYDAYDMYCPVCELTIVGVKEIQKERILNRQEVRKKYEGGITYGNNGSTPRIG